MGAMTLAPIRMLLAALTLLAAGAVPAFAQQPSPVPTHHHHGATPAPRKTPFMTFSDPGASARGPGSMAGTGCQSGRNIANAQHSVNPVTGVKSSTIVSVPLTNGSGSIASSTTKAQQSEACAHGR